MALLKTFFFLEKKLFNNFINL